MSGWPEFLQIIVPGVPVPKGRPRVSTYMTKRGNRITRARTPERTRNFEAQVALYARSKMARLPILHGPVAVHVDCRFALPVGGTGLEKQHDRDVGWHCGRPDADNVAKAVVDALAGIVFVNDSQVAFLSVSKHYVVEPDDGEGVVVIARPLNGSFPEGFPGELYDAISA